MALTFAVYRAACTATVPGLDTGKENNVLCRTEELSASAWLFEVLPLMQVPNSTALRADFAYDDYEMSPP